MNKYRVVVHEITEKVYEVEAFSRREAEEDYFTGEEVSSLALGGDIESIKKVDDE